MIRVKELMIGDWVQNPLGWKAQVQSIRYVNTIKDEWEWLVKIGINNETFQDNLSLNEIVPIPITPEILEKIGFGHGHGFENRWYDVKIEDKEVTLYQSNTFYALKIDEGIWPMLNNIYIRFVHELQNALRFCGIEKEIEL